MCNGGVRGRAPFKRGGGPGGRKSLEGGGGLPPFPPPHCTDPTPKAFPYPNTSPQPHLQPPVTASPNRFHIPCDRSATALGLPRCLQAKPCQGGWVGGSSRLLCDMPSGCCFFTGPWTVTRSSLRMLRRVAAFCRLLRPVLLLVSFPRSRSPVVGVLGLCWMRRDVPFAHQRCPVVGVPRSCWLLRGSSAPPPLHPPRSGAEFSEGPEKLLGHIEKPPPPTIAT